MITVNIVTGLPELVVKDDPFAIALFDEECEPLFDSDYELLEDCG